jgi:hypothetical protein
MPESSEIRAALAANGRFYSSFAAGDDDGMEALWSTTAPVLCIHPGSPAIHGRAGVMASWRAVLERPPAVRASDAQVAVIRGVAFVTCLEHIGEVKLAATNVFVWEDGAWRLVHHQAGPVRNEVDGVRPPGPLH